MIDDIPCDPNPGCGGSGLPCSRCGTTEYFTGINDAGDPICGSCSQKEIDEYNDRINSFVEDDEDDDVVDNDDKCIERLRQMNIEPTSRNITMLHIQDAINKDRLVGLPDINFFEDKSPKGFTDD